MSSRCVRTLSELLTTAAARITSPEAVSTPRTRPRSTMIRRTGVRVRISTPRSMARLESARGTAPVPPRGYHTPSLDCMWAMPHSTAGDSSGALPTYCVKWSSIWAARWSGTNDRTVPATVCPGRIPITSLRIESVMLRRGSNMSFMPPTFRQKKNSFESRCSRSASCMNRA